MISEVEPYLEKKFLENEQGKICYFLNRDFTNRPMVVFLHGLSANHTTWKDFVTALRELKFNVLLLDLRGHGYSDKTRKRKLYKLPVFTRDLENIIKKENLSRIVLTGYSYGGFIALDYVLKNPSNVVALILISTNHVNPWKYKWLYFLTWPAYAFLNLLAWLLVWQKRKKYYYFNQETDLGYWRSTFKGFTTMPLSVNLWTLADAAHLDFSQDLGKISCPTLIMSSHNDHLVTETEINDMRNKIKNSQAIIFKETSHFLASRHRDIIIKAIIKFLKENKLT
jgi:pimeloyl-ACP methyl ester carboxylesterase